MDDEITWMKPYTLVYRTSLEKWERFRRFAVMNNLPTDKIDVLIAKIKATGDVSRNQGFRFLIESRNDYVDAVYNNGNHPCPHCLTHWQCKECPLDDGTEGTCCREWRAIRDETQRNYLVMEMGAWTRS